MNPFFQKSIFKAIASLKFVCLLCFFSGGCWTSAEPPLSKTAAQTDIWNVEESTANTYGSDDRIFVGDFVESRAKVDFNFHKNYQIERQLLQDRIVHQHLKLGKTADLPKIIFLAGVMGAGKGYVLEKMGNSEQICLQDYIWIDSDKIKYELPEMSGFVRSDPQTAGTKVQKESGFIKEILLSEALKRNKNIIVDGTLTSLVRHKYLFELIRNDYPQYTIEIIYVVASMEQIQKRIQKRGEETGRFVPVKYVEQSYREIPRTVEALTPLVSKVITIDNNEDAETTLLLYRHGQTDANSNGIVQGQLDFPLNEKGLTQARGLAEKISHVHPDIVAIYSSDLERAYRTAEETANALELPIQKRSALRESNYGLVEGMDLKEFLTKYTPSYKELNQQYPSRKERWDYTNIPGSETNNQLLQRVKEELTEIAERHPGKKIAVFSHGGAIRNFITDLRDPEEHPRLANCDGAIVLYKDGIFTFLREENLLKNELSRERQI